MLATEVGHMKCGVCRRRLGMMAFRCKCSDREGMRGEEADTAAVPVLFFCSKHRFPEDHDCDFDHAVEGRQEVAKSLPVVRGDKLCDRL